MTTPESSDGFGRKLRAVGRSLIASVQVNDAHPDSTLNDRFREAYKTRPDQYRSPRAYSNPPLDILEAETLRASLTTTDDVLNSLPWSEAGLSQGWHLAVSMALSDAHTSDTPYENFVPELSREFVDSVLEKSEIEQRQITIPEQLELAMDISEGSLLGAAVIAHAGSRSIARASDTRIDERFRYTEDEVLKWRDAVSNFEALSNEYDDPPAETYHFWANFIAGLLSETGERRRDKILNPVYRQIYTRTAEITEIMRYKLGRKEGVTHKDADVLGYHLGSMVGSAVQLQKKA